MNKQLTAGRDRRTTVAIAAGLCALAMLMWLAVGQTRAAFVDSIENPGNSFTTGTVEISTSQPGSALFNFTGMLPGHTQTKSITVSNMSSAPLGVRLFGASYTPPSRAGSELADNLDVLVEIVDTASAPPNSGAVVFNGTMAQFATATAWPCGWWTLHDADECAAATPDPGPGPLERLLLSVIPDEQESDAPFDEAFWGRVQGIDNAHGKTQPVSVLWNLVPDDVKEPVEEEDPETYASIEAAVANSPSADSIVPKPSTSPSPAATASEKTYPELGDKLEEVNEDGSEAVYRITVTLASDAGSADIEPSDSVGITFVWEGRA
jgi:hypothetical protein